MHTYDKIIKVDRHIAFTVCECIHMIRADVMAQPHEYKHKPSTVYGSIAQYMALLPLYFARYLETFEYAGSQVLVDVSLTFIRLVRIRYYSCLAHVLKVLLQKRPEKLSVEFDIEKKWKLLDYSQVLWPLNSFRCRICRYKYVISTMDQRSWWINDVSLTPSFFVITASNDPLLELAPPRHSSEREKERQRNGNRSSQFTTGEVTKCEVEHHFFEKSNVKKQPNMPRNACSDALGHFEKRCLLEILKRRL